MARQRKGLLLMLRFDEIVSSVLAHPMPCGVYVRRADLLSPLRTRNCVEARILICVLAYKFMRQPSSPKIGRLLNRDHSTVLNALQVFKHNHHYYQSLYDQLHMELWQQKFSKQQSCKRSILTLQELAA
jgi:Bacterial dnaA protein helix-turn-helix